MAFDHYKTIAVLSRTPGALRAILADLPEPLAESGYGPGTWSAFDILAHLIHGEKTDWIPRAHHILERGESPPFTPFDMTGHVGPSEGRSIGELLEEFEHLRRINISALESLDLNPDTLSLRGVHPEFGPVTLEQHLSTWAVHDLHHIAQVCKAIAYQLKDDVGPWKKYLGIIRRSD